MTEELAEGGSPDDVENEDQPAKPSKPLENAREGLDRVKNKQADLGQQVGDGLQDYPEKALSAFLHYYPMMRFFCWTAHRQHPRSRKPETRVRQHREAHPGFYWTCITIDAVLVAVTTLVLIAAASVALYKTIVL